MVSDPEVVPTQAPPTCYRHPDRETWVRCQRCDRPICPDCMRPAAVGYQCPECVAAGRRTTAPARTTFGGRLSPRAGIVTRLLVLANVVVFLVQLARPDLEVRGAMVPEFVARGEYYRLLTAAFLHAGVLHIAFNMFALYVVGVQLEALLGAGRYLVLYLLSALGGSVLAYLVAPPFQGGVGASGAVFGLFGALFVVGRRLSAEVGGVAALIGINLVLTFLVPGIDWRAHIGGLVTGVLVAAAFVYAPRHWRTLAAVGFPALVAVGLAVAVVVRTAALTAAPVL